MAVLSCFLTRLSRAGRTWQLAVPERGSRKIMFESIQSRVPTSHNDRCLRSSLFLNQLLARAPARPLSHGLLCTMRLAVVLVVLVACTTATASIQNDLLVNSSSAAHATLQDVMEAILPRGPASGSHLNSGRLSAMHGRGTQVEEVSFDINSICFITNSFG